MLPAGHRVLSTAPHGLLKLGDPGLDLEISADPLAWCLLKCLLSQSTGLVGALV